MPDGSLWHNGRFTIKMLVGSNPIVTKPKKLISESDKRFNIYRRIKDFQSTLFPLAFSGMSLLFDDNETLGNIFNVSLIVYCTFHHFVYFYPIKLNRKKSKYYFSSKIIFTISSRSILPRPKRSRLQRRIQSLWTTFAAPSTRSSRQSKLRRRHLRRHQRH